MTAPAWVVAIAIAGLAGCSKAPQQPTEEATEVQQPQPVATAAATAGGKWCFKPSTVQATWDMIEISKGDKYTVIDHFGDGSTSTDELVERPDGLFVDGSDTGDHFVLPAAAGGDLIVADNEGEIGRATAMPQNASPAACFSS